MKRSEIIPISAAIPATRQEDARHYGVHPYFTRRPANVVRKYIECYSQEGDTVLDPFGGTGVTAIESFLLGRDAIHNDLNPFANFIAENIADTTFKSTALLREGFELVRNLCKKPLIEIEKNERSALRWLKKITLPENILLPRSSDAEHFYDLFTTRQLAGLGFIKETIEQQTSGSIKNLLLLAWSASVAKLNKTFLSAKGRAASRGGSSIFSIYRYKLASDVIELPIWETFEGRFENVVNAKEEILLLKRYRERMTLGKSTLDSERTFLVLSCDATKLDKVIKPGSVDYIFTDPPYGGFISYLDLSILWNHWLGFPVDDKTASDEIIVGGEKELSEAHYKNRLGKSIQTSLRLLRPDRWMSIVFQHWDVAYFETILKTAEQNGAVLKSAITQTGDVIWSMHKKKNSASVLSGELILTFYKKSSSQLAISRKKPIEKFSRESTLTKVFDELLSDTKTTFTSESLFNKLVLEFWNRNALECLGVDRKEFVSCLEQRGWKYDPTTHNWSNVKRVKKNVSGYLFDC